MNLVFIISASFPYGEAFSSRARNMVKLFCKCGFHAHIISPNGNCDNCDELDGLNYSVAYVNAPRTKLTLSGIGTSRPYMNALKSYAENHKIDLIVSSSMVFTTDDIYGFAKKNNIPYIVEQCEWYDSSIFKFGKINPYYREHINLIERKNSRVSGVIAISRLFEEHYKSMGVKVMRMPTILDVYNTQYRSDDFCNNKKVNVVFAGSLGKGKENFKPIFNALRKNPYVAKGIIIDIYGATYRELLENLDGDSELVDSISECVKIHGKIPQEEVENKFRQADFSVFFRPNRRSSNAGFPTKLAESMAVGTPVITNNTGDICLYLKNCVNGYVIDDVDVESSVLDIFRKILNSTKSDMINMRNEARKTAELCFDYRNYVDSFENMLGLL